MIKGYLYPLSSRKNISAGNPYLSDFINSLAGEIEFLNIENPSNIGIFHALKFANKIDIIFFNWIEDLPDKKGGFLQVFALIVLIFILKLRKAKIFYTLHNKESHNKKYIRLKRMIKKFVIINSNFILTHSEEGVNIINAISKNKNVKYFPHPFDNNISEIKPLDNNKKYDILLWGTIKPYKGIDRFLKFLYENNLRHKYNILITGIISPKTYEEEILKYVSSNCILKNEFVDDFRLGEDINSSKVVLFTYNEESMLSSGALMYSLSKYANIIGPTAGAFKDIKKQGLIETFDNYDDLIKKLDRQLSQPTINYYKINAFIKENRWEEFGKKIIQWIIPDNNSHLIKIK